MKNIELKGKSVLVVGTGISGIAAAKLLARMGAQVVLFDGNEKITASEIYEKIEDANTIDVMIGTLPEEIVCNLDFVVLSPGVPTDIPLVNKLKEKEVPIWGEIELAYVLGKGNIAAITGTNGKTTTTALVGEIMKSYYYSVFVVGNIGIPYTGIVPETNEDSVIVAEISSFQLETIHTFNPKVSAILNISPDHLNRHHTMENYIDAKLQIAKNQDKTKICVLNYDDLVLRKISGELSAKPFFFSRIETLEEGVYLKQNGDIVLAENGAKDIVCNIKELQLLGNHNYENIMAGISIAIHMGVPMDCIRKVITTFTGVEHRIEYVAEKNGVKYYNDSKATNTDAAIRGIQAMITPTILIGGGYDKGSEFDEWILAFDGKVKQLVLLGQTSEKIAETAKKHGFQKILVVDSLEEAVAVCEKNAQPGESVLLSPACASWGMFKNFEERGNKFKELVDKM